MSILYMGRPCLTAYWLACFYLTSIFCWLGTVIHRWLIQLGATPSVGLCSMPDPQTVDACPDVARQAFFGTEAPPSWLFSTDFPFTHEREVTVEDGHLFQPQTLSISC